MHDKQIRMYEEKSIFFISLYGRLDVKYIHKRLDSYEYALCI